MRLIPDRLFGLFVFSNLRQLCNASGQKCYSPDGNIMALGRPCLPKLDVSPCCGLGWECLANGICHDVEFPPGLGLARGGCTESPWKSGYCPNFCKGKGSEYFPLLYYLYQLESPAYKIVTRNPFLANLSGGTGVIRCSEYTYCCEGDDDCHCGNNTNLVIFQAGTSAYTLISDTTADSQQTTASATAEFLSKTLPIPNTATATPAAENASSQPQSDSSKDIVKVAVGIGVPFGVVIVGVIAALILWRQRRRKRALGHAPAFPETTKVLQPPSNVSSPYLSSRSQQDGVASYRGFEPAELQQPRNPQELDNSTPSTAQKPPEAGSSLWAGNSPSVGSYSYSSTDRVPSPMQPRPL